MKQILVAVDETDGSRRAAEFVERFFAGMDVSITAVNVARVPVEWLGPAPYGGLLVWPWGASGAVREDERSRVDDAMARQEADSQAVAVAQAPADAEVSVVFGEAVEAISQAADSEGADVIVVGSNHKGLVQRLLGGSVSEELARSSSIPVLVVH